MLAPRAGNRTSFPGKSVVGQAACAPVVGVEGVGEASSESGVPPVWVSLGAGDKGSAPDCCGNVRPPLGFRRAPRGVGG